MDDLLAWLRERIAEDREWASDIGSVYPDPYDPGCPAHHLSVLDLCDAHDALLDAYEQAKAKADEHSQRFVANLRVGQHIYTPEYQEERQQGSEHTGRMWGMHVAILAISAAYRRDPGYREEWARWAGVPAEDEVNQP